MSVLRKILGVFMIFGAISVLTVPLAASVALCWIISAIMLFAGIFSVISYFEARNSEKIAEKAGQTHIKTGIGNLIFGIVLIVISILSKTSVIGYAVFMNVITVIYAIWLILNGISCIVCGRGIKAVGGSGWVGLTILGILIIVAGIFCIANIFVALSTIGMIFGISMMMSGFSLLFS